MADIITRLKINSDEYNSKIKRAVTNLQQMEQECRRVNGTLAKLEQDQKQYVQSLGQMETVSRNARGKISELSSAFVELHTQYNRLTDEEKKGDFGKALSSSLDQLKTRIRDAKKEMSDIQAELNGSTSKFGNFGKVIDTVGQRLGVSGNITEMLTSKTAMMYAGIGAGIAVVGEATKAWMSYNAELAKQDQITKVTTGLEGPDSNRMTDAARAMADVYKVDFREAINAANTLMAQFGKTGDEAIQLLRDGMQGMVMGDGQKLLNMIKQYAPAFRDAGISASQLVAIIQNSEGGIFTDQNMNAIVMGIKNIRLMTKATSDALAKLGIDGQDMTKKLNDGTMTIFDALKQVMGALQNVGSGSQAAGEIMQTVFGRTGYQAGTNLAKAIESLNTNLQETKKQTGEVGEAYNDLLQSTEKLNTAIREAFGYNGWEEMANGIKSKLITALADVLTLLNKIRDYDMPDWLKGPGDKPKPFSGTKVDTDYIARGSSKTDREKRYNTVTGNINKKLQNLNAQEAALGKPYTYTDKNGGLVEQIDTPEEVAQKRRQIQSSRQILTRRLNNIQSQHDTLTAEPPKANTIPPKTGGSGGSTGGGRSLSTQEQADAKYVQAQKDYEQSLQQAALEVKAGTINSAEAKKKELQAAETLWKSIGDAREVYDSPKLKDAQAKVEERIVALGPEVEKAIEAQKAVEKASRELEMASKKAADARAKLADAEATGELKKILPAQKAVTEADREVTRKETVLHELQEKTVKVNVEQGNVNLPKVPTDDETIKVNVEQGSVNLPKVPTDDQTIKVNVEQGDVNLPEIPTDDETIKVNAGTGDVNLPEIPDEKTIKVDAVPGNVKLPEVKEEVQVPAVIKPTQDNIDAAISFLKDKIAEEKIGTDVFNKLTEQLSDATALGGIISEMVKQGVNTADFSDAINSMWAQLKKGDIDDSAIQSFLEKVNEKIKEQGGIQLDMNANTGEVSRKKKDDDELKETQKVVSGLSQVASGLQAMGIILPSEVTKVLSMLQGAMTVVQGVTTIVSVFGSTSMGANTAALGANTGAMIANTAAMVALQAAMDVNTASNFIPFFAEGGVVHAAGGVVAGTTYSGDQIPAMLNAGEVVLNRAQVGNLAEQLEDRESISGIGGTPYVTGEQIYLGLNNYLKGAGLGSLVTSQG